MTPRDWVLLTVGLPDDGTPVSGLDQVRLMKVLFLLQKKHPQQEGLDFDFEPYLYGPFTKAIYDHVESLASEGLVSISPLGPRRVKYVATPDAVERARELSNEVSDDVLETLRTIRNWAVTNSFENIVQQVYEEYPDQQENSIFGT